MKLCWRIACLILALAGAGAEAATYEVDVYSYFFEPSLLTINTGDTIEWVAYGSGHIVISDTEVFNSLLVWGNAIPTLRSYKFTFHNPGTYPYYSLEFGGPEGMGMSASVMVVGAPTNQVTRTPTNSLPVIGATNQPIQLELRATAFSDPDGGDLHAASQWIVQRGNDNQMIYDSGEVTDNGLGSDSKTNRYLPAGLLHFSTVYSWRVRFKDSYGTWSAFSAATTFSTLAPTLLISRHGADVVFSWPTNSDGFSLVYSSNVVGSNWLPVSPPPLVILGRNTVTNSLVATGRFYRLEKL